MRQQQPTAVNGTGIVHRTSAEISKHLEEQEKSGISVKDYCEMFELDEALFLTWQKGAEEEGEDLGGFARIELVNKGGSKKPVLFAEIGRLKLYKEVSVDYLKQLL